MKTFIVLISALVFSGCLSLQNMSRTSKLSEIRTVSRRGEFVVTSDRENLVSQLLQHPEVGEDAFEAGVEVMDSLDPVILFDKGSLALNRNDLQKARKNFEQAAALLEKDGMPTSDDSSNTPFLVLKKAIAQGDGEPSPGEEADVLASFKNYLQGNADGNELLQSVRMIQHRTLPEARYSGGAGLLLSFLQVYGAPTFDPVLANYPFIRDGLSKRRFKNELYADLGLTLFLLKDFPAFHTWSHRVKELGLTSDKIGTLILISRWLNSERISSGEYIPTLTNFLTGG